MNRIAATRDWENMQKAMFPGVGIYGVPEIPEAHYTIGDAAWISCNFARTCEEPEEHALHFFVDDYQFTRYWRDPDKYLAQLRKFVAVASPDFSLYTDFPVALQIYNHFRSQWLGAYWAYNGVRVIPTVSWSDEASFEWCFDGVPSHSQVIISSVGVCNKPDERTGFIRGYNEMLRRLEPTEILFVGKIPPGCDGPNTWIPAFSDKFREV